MVGTRKASFPWSLFFKEELRNGSIELINHLSKNAEIWIYTSSLRHPGVVKFWFSLFGLKVDGVINSDIHREIVRNSIYKNCTKAPGMFDIDFLIDDSQGVKLECKGQKTKVILVNPADVNWKDTILNEMNFV